MVGALSNPDAATRDLGDVRDILTNQKTRHEAGLLKSVSLGFT